MEIFARVSCAPSLLVVHAYGDVTILSDGRVEGRVCIATFRAFTGPALELPAHLVDRDGMEAAARRQGVEQGEAERKEVVESRARYRDVYSTRRRRRRRQYLRYTYVDTL